MIRRFSFPLARWLVAMAACVGSAAAPSAYASASERIVQPRVREPLESSSCSEDGWCTVPTPLVADTLKAGWARSRDDVWIVGGWTALHLQSGRWSRVAVPPHVSLEVAWGTPDGTVFFGGMDVREDSVAGAFLRWNGARLEKLAAPGNPISSLWGVDPTDMFAVAEPDLLRWDGRTWTAIPLPARTLGRRVSPTSIWGADRDHVWVTTNEGVHRLEGTSLGPVLVPSEALVPFGHISTTQRVAMWGSGPDDVWAVGPRAILHWNGATWSPAPGSASAVTVESIAGNGPDRAWALLNEHLLRRFDGREWSDAPVDLSRAPDLMGIVASPGGDVFLFGDGAVYRLGERGARLEIGPGVAFVRAIAGTGPEDVWALGGSYGVDQRWDGGTWSLAFDPAVEDASLSGACRLRSGEIWAVESGPNDSAVVRWAAGWRVVGEPVHDVAWSGCSDDGGGGVWIAGMTHGEGDSPPTGALVARWDGRRWRQVLRRRGPPLAAIAARARDDVWVGGEAGLLLHFDGKRWLDVRSGVRERIASVMLDENAAWAVGGDRTTTGFVLRCTSAGCEREHTVPAPLRAVVSCGALGTFAVGAYGTILRRADGKWAKASVPGGADLQSVWCDGTGGVWAGGTGQTILRWRAR